MARRLIGVLLLLCPLCVFAQEIKTDFASDADGWFCAGGLNRYESSGGNPGGYLFVDNSEIEIVWCSAPSKFLGNLLSYNGGSFSFDGKLILDQAPYWTEEQAAPYGGNYGTVRITGPAGSVSADLEVGKPSSNWATYGIDMTAAAWGIDENKWRNILANVTSIEINLEALYGEEQEGLDNVVLSGGAPLSIVSPESFAGGEVGEHYVQLTHASGGTPPYLWSFEGDLPSGIAIDDRFGGSVYVSWTGTLTQAGTFSFKVVVVDDLGQTATRDYQVTVNPPGNPVVDLTNLAATNIPEGEIWVRPDTENRMFRLTAEKGQAPYEYSWDLQSQDIHLDPKTGEISGKIPNGEFLEETTIPVLAQVRDANGNTGTKAIAIRVLFPPEPVDLSPLPDATVGVPYQFQFHARYGGGSGHLSWDNVTSTPYPPGLDVGFYDGLFSGTPTQAGDYDVPVTVNNRDLGFTGISRTYKLHVAAASAPGPGPKLNTSQVSCEAIQDGLPGETAPVTSTGGNLGVDTSGAAPWLGVRQSPNAAPGPPLKRQQEVTHTRMAVQSPVATAGESQPSFETLVCNPASLAPGRYTTHFTINGKTLTVVFYIGAPTPTVQPVPRKAAVHLQTGGKAQPFRSQFRLNLGSLPSNHVAKLDFRTFTQKVSSDTPIGTGKPATVTTEFKPEEVPEGHTTATLRAEVGDAGISSIPVDFFRSSAAAPGVRPLGFASSFPDPSRDDSETVFLRNTTAVPLPWKATVKGPAAATVSPDNGTLAPGATQQLGVQVPPPSNIANPSSGSIEIEAGGTTREVSFTTGQTPTPYAEVVPASLSFAARGATLQASLRNASDTARDYACFLPADTGFALEPGSGNLAAGASVQLNIQANPDGDSLAEADAVCQVGDEVTTLHLAAMPAGACNAGSLLVQPEVPSVNALMQTGRTYPVRTIVRDNCGATVDDAFVALLDGAESVVLDSVGDGRYVGEWTPLEAGSTPLTLSATANALSGEARLYPRVLNSTDGQPRVEAAAPRGAAGFAARLTPAAGSLITLFGEELADDPIAASTIPLPDTLGQTSVTLGGRPLPLLYVSPTQINALVLYDIPKFVPLELVVLRGNRRSAAFSVTIDDSAPDLFTFNDGTNTLGIFLDSNFSLVTGARRLKRGSVGILLATGLGDVTPALAANQQTAGDIHILVGVASLKIGGWNAHIEYAGLLPGYAGVYQINFDVPEDVDPGLVPVILTINGKPSNTVMTQIE